MEKGVRLYPLFCYWQNILKQSNRPNSLRNCEVNLQERTNRCYIVSVRSPVQ